MLVRYVKIFMDSEWIDQHCSRRQDVIHNWSISQAVNELCQLCSIHFIASTNFRSPALVNQILNDVTHLRERSSSSPPLNKKNYKSIRDYLSIGQSLRTHHPQNELEKPLTALNCLVVIDDTPPKIEVYGNLKIEIANLWFFAQVCFYSLEAKGVNSYAL